MFAFLIFVVTVFPLTFATVGAKNMLRSPYDREVYYCLLPPYPDHGRYTVSNHPYAIPGRIYSSVKLDIFCDFGYLNNSTIKSIYCINGDWSASIPHCVRDSLACGLKTQDGQLPWEAAIYRKISKTSKLISAGALITATKIISKASSFHNNNSELLPASNFVVAVDNKYKLYKDTPDPNSQQSDVIDIKVHSNYGGKYENDIAIVVVKTPFHFHMSVLPVCLDFGHNLEGTQLTKGSSGKTLRWTTTLDKMSYGLDEVDLSYVTNEDCKNMLSTDNPRYFDKDNFCMRCDLDIWNSLKRIEYHLAFLESTTQRYYLRGMGLNSARTKNGKREILLYTLIGKYEDFIKEHL